VADDTVQANAVRACCAIIHTMLSYSRRPGALVASALVFLHMAAATDLPRLSFNQLTDDSELVVSGRVTRTWAAWDADHKFIWTHYELTVTATHKGSAGQTVDIAEPGGQLDGMGMSISGGTGYRVGDSVLVFLSRMPNGYLRTAGLGQGKYEVDSKGVVHGLTIFKTDAMVTGAKGPVTSPSAIRSLEGMTVGQVRQFVAARVRTPGGAR
jgi:hypothetical protein